MYGVYILRLRNTKYPQKVRLIKLNNWNCGTELIKEHMEYLGKGHPIKVLVEPLIKLTPYPLEIQ